jgi:hypothetical protein
VCSKLTLVVTVFVLLAWPAMPQAATASQKITWANEQWIPVNLSSEGVTIKEIRFEVEGGVHWNPLRAGKGPQCFVRVKNESGHEATSASSTRTRRAKSR